MTFSETSWLLLGALLSGLAAYAVPLGMSLFERVVAGSRGNGTQPKGPTAGIFEVKSRNTTTATHTVATRHVSSHGV